MEFDFAKLKKRILSQHKTISKFAIAVDLSPTQMALRLEGRLPFLVAEIVKIAEVLEIPGSEIELYFFTPKFDFIELRKGA